MLEFQYDGNIKQITASKDCTVYFALKGAGGGGGGRDTGPGSSGTDGGFVKGTIFMPKDSSVFVAVGSSGEPGWSSAGSGGGNGGYSIDGFSGGKGGNAGPSGASGGGGGGGGATVLTSIDVPGDFSTLNWLAVAGGGAGGGGGGNVGASAGYLLPTSSYTYCTTFPTALFYPHGDINPSYSSFLNTYGVWNWAYNPNTFTYDAYFAAGTYNAEMSADDYAQLSIDGLAGPFNGYPYFFCVDYTKVYNQNFTIPTAGWYTLRFFGRNNSGAASVAFRIKDNTGAIIFSSRSLYNFKSTLFTSNSRGGAGQNHRYDGGGAGGGGGGYPSGGNGSIAPTADIGAPGGTPGQSYRHPTLTNAVPSSALFSDFNSASFGGGGRGSLTQDNSGAFWGGNGYAAFYAESNDAISIKSGNDWIKPSKIYVKKNGSWIESSVYVKKNGSWIPMYGDPLTFTSITGSFNSTSGPMQPYPADIVFTPVVYSGGGGGNRSTPDSGSPSPSGDGTGHRGLSDGNQPIGGSQNSNSGTTGGEGGNSSGGD